MLRVTRLIVPLSLRTKVVNLVHESHQGIVCTKQHPHDLYWWPQMDNLSQSIISSCVTCQLSDKTAKTFPALLQQVKLPEGPWQKVAIDIVGLPLCHHHDRLFQQVARGGIYFKCHHRGRYCFPVLGFQSKRKSPLDCY